MSDLLWDDRELARVWRPQNTLQWATLNCNAVMALMGGTAGSYKALDVHTPIPTPSGWKEMGDLGIGDLVLDEQGNVCSVIGVSPVFVNQPSFQITFSDGEALVASADHRWLTMDYKERERALKCTPEWRARRRAKRPSRAVSNTKSWLTLANKNRTYRTPPPVGSVRTTEEIAATLTGYRGRLNHSIQTTHPLLLPAADMAVEPYVLGAWLGDGASAHGGLTCADPQIVDEIRNCGFAVRKQKDRYGWGILELVPRLRTLGVLHNKHIPALYLRGSYEQRLALLQGLMDTDGSCSISGICTFVNTNRRLIDGILELLKSLGIKAAANEYVANINGIDIGPVWHVGFATALPIFRLARKARRAKACKNRPTNGRRYVVEVKPVESRPMRCIAVSSASHLFLAGRGFIPTHNSETLVVDPLRYRRNPAAKAVIFRNTRPELNQLIDRAKAIYTQLGANYRTQQKTFTFPSGATVLFDYMDREDHETRQFSQEYDYVGFDESTRNKRGIARVRFMFSRLRSRNQYLQTRTRMRLGTNPGGPANNDHKHIFIGPRCSHCAIHRKRGFVKGSRIPGKIYYDATWPNGDKITVDPKFPVSTVFIPGRLDEANILGGQYSAYLKMLPGFLQKALLSGCWDITEGQYFDIWDETKMVVPRPGIGDQFWWPHWISLDYGFKGSHASAHLHCKSPAFDVKLEDGKVLSYPNGRIFTIGEIIEEHMLAADFAVKVKERWDRDNRTIHAWYASPDLWNETGDGHTRADQMMKAAKINLEKASNDRVGGAMLMYQLLRDGGWQIADTCVEAVRAIPWAVHDTEEGGDPDDVLKVPGELLDDVYDSCFVAGTMITTKAGDKPIEEVKEGDLVLTRKGYRKVLHAWLTKKDAEIMELTLSDGRMLRGTGNHPVFVPSRGFIRMDGLRYGDKLLSCESKSSHSTESSFDATRTRNREASGSTSIQAELIANEASNRSIRRFGQPLTALYPPDATSIIETMILSTTGWKIWNAYQTRIMRGIMERRKLAQKRPNSIWMPSVPLPLNGMGLRTGSSGTAPIRRQCGKSADRGARGAATVKTSTQRKTARENRDSAPILASQPGGENKAWIMSPENARCARSHSLLTSTRRHGHVAEPALHVIGGRSAGRADVYNITVADQQEYFANGILVHNCRYGMYSYIGSAEKPREVVLQEAVTSTDPTVAMMQYRMAEEKLNAAEAPMFLRGGRFRRGR